LRRNPPTYRLDVDRASTAATDSSLARRAWVDSLPKGSGQTASSQKSRNSPYSTLMRKLDYTVEIAKGAHLKHALPSVGNLWPFCEYMCREGVRMPVKAFPPPRGVLDRVAGREEAAGHGVQLRPRGELPGQHGGQEVEEVLGRLLSDDPPPAKRPSGTRGGRSGPRARSTPTRSEDRRSSPRAPGGKARPAALLPPLRGLCRHRLRSSRQTEGRSLSFLIWGLLIAWTLAERT